MAFCRSSPRLQVVSTSEKVKALFGALGLGAAVLLIFAFAFGWRTDLVLITSAVGGTLLVVTVIVIERAVLWRYRCFGRNPPEFISSALWWLAGLVFLALMFCSVHPVR